MQGVLVKRHRVPRGGRGGEDQQYWHWTNLNIGKEQQADTHKSSSIFFYKMVFYKTLGSKRYMQYDLLKAFFYICTSQ